MKFSNFQIYQAFLLLLEHEWQKNTNSYLSVVLTELVITDTGSTVDPTLWHEWLTQVSSYKKSHFSEQEGLQAIILFLNDYISRCYHDDIRTLINNIQNCLKNTPIACDMWRQWLYCLSQMYSTIDYTKTIFSDFETFKAARLFLENQAIIKQSILLQNDYESMLLDSRGYTIDQRAWNNWLDYLKQCRHTTHTTAQNCKEIYTSAQDAFKAFVLLLKQKSSDFDIPVYSTLIAEMNCDNENYPQNPVMWEQWVDCFRRLNSYQIHMELSYQRST